MPSLVGYSLRTQTSVRGSPVPSTDTIAGYQGPGFFYERYSAVNQLKLEGYPTLPEDEERVAQSWEEMEQARLVEEAMQGTHQTTANQTV